jgi:GntR family transcriptional regulator
MDFRENAVIYLQIVDYINDHILLGTWASEEKIPSVRDLAVELVVNPNTVMRAYDYLQQRGIISNRRGLGNFVNMQARELILADRRIHFLDKELPVIFRNMYILGIGFDELKEGFEQYVSKNFPEK